MWPNPQEAADLVTFTEEILNGKLHFLFFEVRKFCLWLLHLVSWIISLFYIMIKEMYTLFIRTTMLKSGKK